VSEEVEKRVVITFSARNLIKETADEIQVNLRGLSFQFMGLGYSINEMNRLLFNSSAIGKEFAGVMQTVGAALRIANIVSSLTSALQALSQASWVVTIAEHARAVAHFIANAVASWGVAVPIMLAAAAAVGGLTYYFSTGGGMGGGAPTALGSYAGRQFGGLVTQPGLYYLHGGEVVPRMTAGTTAYDVVRGGSPGGMTVMLNDPVFRNRGDMDYLVDRLKRMGQA
jgi:hypothetical protein